MFEMIIDYEKLASIAQEFWNSGEENAFEEAVKWVKKQEGHVVLLNGAQNEGLATMTIETFNILDDYASAHAYLPHWEMYGFAVDDMPTLQDLLIGADTDYLLAECLKVVQQANRNLTDETAIQIRFVVNKYLQEVRETLFTSRINSSSIIMPTEIYWADDDGSSVYSQMQATLFSAQDIIDNKTNDARRQINFDTPKVLQYKTWFGGLTIRNTYRSLSWILLQILHSDFEKENIEICITRETQEADSRFDEFYNAEKENLKTRIKDLAERIVDPEELELLTLQFEDELFQELSSECKAKGLTLQNGIHILLRRFIATLPEEDKEEDTEGRNHQF